MGNANKIEWKKQTKNYVVNLVLILRKKGYTVKKLAGEKIYKNSGYVHEAKLWDILLSSIFPVPIFSPFIASSPPLTHSFFEDTFICQIFWYRANRYY